MRAATLLIAVAAFACGQDAVVPNHAEPRLRRLLAKQYTNSVRVLLGDRAAAAAKPPPDIASKGFESIGATELVPSDSALAQYELSASAVVAAAMTDPSSLPIGCTPTSFNDTACFDTFVRTFGRRAFRRPLAEAEVTRYVELTSAVAGRYNDPYAGIGYAISGFLQSPHFLYQVEIGEEDPDDESRRRLTGYEIATRMSMFLLDATPDDALLDAAPRLTSRDAVRTQATELVERDEARAALDNFYTERFKLRDVATLTKDPELFPAFNTALAQAMYTESLMLLHDVVWDRDADIRELLDAPYAFVNSELATLYGTQPVTGPAFEKRMLPAERRGMFGQAAFLASQAHPGTTSPTRRGRYVSERLLCIDVPPPPPEVNTELPPPIPNMPMTMRQRLAQHSSVEQCASCHRRMDGIGLALENFDAIGAYRVTDEGLPIDASGEIYQVGTFQGLAGLTELARELPELPRCWVRSLYRHATGHFEAERDEVVLEEIDERWQAANYKLKSVLIDIVASDAFRYVDNVRAP